MPKLSNQNRLVLKLETLTLTNPKPASALNSIDRTFAVAAAMAVALARPPWPSAKPPSYPIKIKFKKRRKEGQKKKGNWFLPIRNHHEGWRVCVTRRQKKVKFHIPLPHFGSHARRSTQPHKKNSRKDHLWRRVHHVPPPQWCVGHVGRLTRFSFGRSTW